jgi:photosystem II stability/assembly factor-like uncharacterized protein
VQHPENPDVIILLTHYGISISEDFGHSWRSILERYPGGQSLHFAFHPLDGNTIFYTGENLSFSGVIYRSPDGGNSWTVYDTSMLDVGGDNCVHSIAYHPTNPDILVYGGEGKIGKSTDRGATWNVTDLYETAMYFFKALFDNDNPDILYATGGGGGESIYGEIFNLYRSTDMGNTWHHVFEKDTKIEWGGSVLDMVKYKNRLLIYSWGGGVVELEILKD